jgi:predicted Zn-dependent protease
MVEMYDRRVQLEEIIRPEEFQVVTAQPGTDLRKLAIQFYGTADNWDRIAKQNGLVSSVVPDGIEEIIIPLILSDSTDPKRSGCTP